MNGPTQEEARSLLEGPPQYEDSIPTEQFEVDDAVETEGIPDSPPGRRGLLQSMRRLSKNSIEIPVRHIIDPIVQFYHSFSAKLDWLLSRIGNPLLVKRMLFVVFTGAVLVTVYFAYVVKIPPKEGHFDHSELRRVLKSTLAATNFQGTSDYFGEMPHFAGSLADKATADYVAEFFESLGMVTGADRHDVYLSHGDHNLCELKQVSDQSVVWSSELQEPTVLENPSMAQKQPPTQLALVAPGEAEGMLVYGNFGRAIDLNTLDIDGKIVLVKLGMEDSGSVANRVQAMGGIGLLFMPSKHPTEPSWPDGADYPLDAIQQGSIGSPSRFPGDILSPGWPSSLDQKVDRQKSYTASIPAAAISWNDAFHLLGSLKGSGSRIQDPSWENHGAPQLDEWWTGPNPEFSVHLKASPIAEDRHQIINVFGKMKGREADDRVLFVGARLDAMCYGATQLSGLTVLLAVAHALAEMQYSQQWRPLRSIYFIAWDGTSHNYAGSTEWAESVADHLSVEGVAYIDLDLGVSGSDFVAQGNPLIDIQSVLGMVEVEDNHSLLDFVDQQSSFKPIPGYGNHIAFEAHTGVPSIRLGFHNRSRPVPVDSCYDSIEWMRKYGDPDYSRHLALAEATAYLALELGDGPIVPLKFDKMVEFIRSYAAHIGDAARLVFPHEDLQGEINDAMSALTNSADLLDIPAQTFAAINQQWLEFVEINQAPSGGKLSEPLQVERSRNYWNEKLIQANKATLDRNGISLPRNWYKNHVFGPPAESYTDDVLNGVFPAVVDALHSASFAEFIAASRDAAAHIENTALYLDELGY